MKKIIDKIGQMNLAAGRGLGHSSNKGFIIAISILAFMLITLAVLQYFWLDQLSEGEKVRMKNNLKISTQSFAQDFDEELTKIYKTFREENFRQDSSFSRIDDAFEQSRKKLLHPDLIEKVFFVEINRDSDFVVKYKFPQNKNDNKNNFPYELIDLKDKLKGRSINFLESLITLSHTPVLDKNNSLIIINQLPQSFSSVSEVSNESFIAIKLNNLVIKQLLNKLTRKYFYADSSAVYNTAIIKADSNKTLFYSSDPEKTADYYLSNSDESEEIGKWRSDQFMIATAQFSISDTITKKSGNMLGLIKKKNWSVEVIKGDSVHHNESFRFIMAKNVPWQLYIRHQSGDLETLIEDSHLRNLFISYLIILILGISIAFVFYSSHKAKKTARSQIEFVAGLTHELRTPLAAIRSAAENLKDGILNSDDQQKKYGQLIYDENLRLSNMIEQTLQFAGLTNGSHENSELINLSELIESVLHEIDPVNKRQIELNISQNLILSFNKNALTIIVRNLVSNALKYSSPDKKVIINAALNPSSNNIDFEIADQGTGIEPEDLKHIFDPFFRGKFAKENHVSGSGIGLSLVKKIIDEHNGQIDISTNVGKGSSFKIKIPLSGNYKNV